MYRVIVTRLMVNNSSFSDDSQFELRLDIEQRGNMWYIFNTLLDHESETNIDKLYSALNMEEAIYQYLERTDKHSPIKDIFQIEKVVLNLCLGCKYDNCGQDDHMDCPTGCLHNPENCSSCS